MQESEVKLLPCPFCSESQIKLTEWPAITTVCEVFCLNCKINTGAKFTKEEAIKHWNCRTPDTTKLVEALNPRLWNQEMHDAWHKNIPDIQRAFDALREQALESVKGGK